MTASVIVVKERAKHHIEQESNAGYQVTKAPSKMPIRVEEADDSYRV
jgi:hypothetical protein